MPHIPSTEFLNLLWGEDEDGNKIEALGFILLDVDGTLYDDETWLIITKFIGGEKAVQEHKKIFDYYMRGLLTIDEFTMLLLAIWQSYCPDREQLKQKFQAAVISIQVREDFIKSQFIPELIKLGLIPIVATGGLREIAASLAQQLRLAASDTALTFIADPYLTTDEKGKILAINHSGDISKTKRRLVEARLKEICEFLRLDLEKLIIIAIGDGNSDLDLFLWGLVYGIAYTTDKQELIDAAKQQAANASEMLKIIKERLEQ